MNLNSVAYIGGIILALQIIPQMIKIYQSKSASDLSYIFMFLNILGLSMMFVYALNNNDRPLYVTSGISIINTLFLVYMKYYYDRQNNIVSPVLSENNIIDNENKKMPVLNKQTNILTDQFDNIF
jgi:MtN3 and saliva related transmembrane protein